MRMIVSYDHLCWAIPKLTINSISIHLRRCGRVHEGTTKIPEVRLRFAYASVFLNSLAPIAYECDCSSHSQVFREILLNLVLHQC